MHWTFGGAEYHDDGFSVTFKLVDSADGKRIESAAEAEIAERIAPAIRERLKSTQEYRDLLGAREQLRAAKVRIAGLGVSGDEVIEDLTKDQREAVYWATRSCSHAAGQIAREVGHPLVAEAHKAANEALGELVRSSLVDTYFRRHMVWDRTLDEGVFLRIAANIAKELAA